MQDLAAVYSALAGKLELADITAVGKFHWQLDRGRTGLSRHPRIGGSCWSNAVVLQLDDHPSADFFSSMMDQVANLAYYEPDKFRIDIHSWPCPRLVDTGLCGLLICRAVVAVLHLERDGADVADR